jgi:2,3-bisphosphoglycerate-dependent phosphoglycerate mutase
MALSAWVGQARFELGSSSFLKAWFSTIFVRLESERWGSRFAVVMNEFYGGTLQAGRAAEALRELGQIRDELTQMPPSEIVWDFEDREAQPPWGTEVSDSIRSLGNYFVTSDGRDLFDVLANSFSEADRSGQALTLQPGQAESRFPG